MHPCVAHGSGVFVISRAGDFALFLHWASGLVADVRSSSRDTPHWVMTADLKPGLWHDSTWISHFPQHRQRRETKAEPPSPTCGLWGTGNGFKCSRVTARAGHSPALQNTDLRGELPVVSLHDSLVARGKVL